MITKYDLLMYDSGPVKFSDYISGKYDKCHNLLYIYARNKIINDELLYDELLKLLDKFGFNYSLYEDIANRKFSLIECIDFLNNIILNYLLKYEMKKYINLDSYLKNHKIIEIKQDEYWKPSKMIVIDKTYPFTRKTYDLSKYWLDVYNRNTKNLSLLKDLENALDSEVIFLNYVSGKATMQSRMNDIEYDIDFNCLDDNAKISEQYTLSDTFTEKYNKI